MLTTTLQCGLLLFPLCACVDAPSELAELSLEKLLQAKISTVIGSSRYEQEASEAPGRVSIIDAATIRFFGNQNPGGSATG